MNFTICPPIDDIATSYHCRYGWNSYLLDDVLADVLPIVGDVALIGRR